MNFIRKSRWTPPTVWILTLALVSPMLLLSRQAANAQNTQPLRVIVADFVPSSRNTSDIVARNATDAVYNELVASGQGRFDAVPNREVLAEAKAEGLRVPSVAGQPANFSKFDYLRIAKALNVDAIVTGVVTASAARGRAGSAIIDVRVHDVAADEDTSGGQSRVTLRPRPGMAEDNEELISNGLRDAALDVVRQLVQRQIVTGTVLNLNSNVVVINRGSRDGLHVGDELVILRNGPNNQLIRHGRATIARAYATDSEADVKENVSGIAPEDLVRVLYRPQFVYSPEGDSSRSVVSRGLNFSTIGKTLSVIGLGVLIAVAIKGGQASVTNVRAEPGTESNQPIVRVTWGDNIFGQSGVLQYHVYRNPDFPFYTSGIGSSNGNGSGNGGGTGGGTGNGTTNLGIGVNLPINVAAQNATREVFDRPSPFTPYTAFATVLFGSGNGSQTGIAGNNGTSGGNGGGNTSGGCGVGLGVLSLDTGFRSGTTYTYAVTAVIQRTPVNISAGSVSSNTTGGTGGGTATGGTNGGGNQGGSNGNTNNGSECIETDPVRSGNATPITPVLITAPLNNASSVSDTQFNVQFGSRAGADVFQIEISTDRSFSNPNNIFRQQIFSTAPNQEAVTQTLATAVNLRLQTALSQNPAYAAYIKNPSANPAPTLYLRVGARHDEDQPGPINVFSRNASDGDRTFRFIYSNIVQFTFPILPPGQPDALRSKTGTAKMLTDQAHKSRLAGLLPLPLPGDRALSGKRGLSSIQDLLTGRGRPRN